MEPVKVVAEKTLKVDCGNKCKLKCEIQVSIDIQQELLNDLKKQKVIFYQSKWMKFTQIISRSKIHRDQQITVTNL